MKRFKYLALLMVIMLVVGCLATPAFARGGARVRTSYAQEADGVCTDEDGNAMDYSIWVYGISIFADATNSFMGVYDVDTWAELAASTAEARDEIGEATQYDTSTHWYEQPRYYSDGVGIIMTTGVGFVHYGPEPSNP